ncbi:MAG TPA: tetratricopeptide repeat protein [Longimicrobiaceae bacterium]|nr:tetratricopeptide repeat protein [Longimicrobiaceae bacterium]
MAPVKKLFRFRAAILLVFSACAPAAQVPHAPSVPQPAQIPALEARFASDTTNLRVLVPLASAYVSASRSADAVPLLERAVRRDPDNSGALLYLGLAYEDLERFSDARQLYERYLEHGRSEELKARIRARLSFLERLELRAAIEETLARESELADTEPRPNTVAVFPFLYSGSDSTLAPLGRAFAEMLVTDLSQTDRLTVLERTGVQILLDELALGRSGLVDTTTAARSGRILGAGRIVQGRIDGNAELLRLHAAVVGVGDEWPGSTLTAEDQLERLFALQTDITFGIFDALGIQLTPAERERVSRRPTANLQAVLAFGLGLEAQDAGDFAAAARQFNRAASLDPDFVAAQQHATDAANMQAASETTVLQLARLGTVELDSPGSGTGTLADLDALQSFIPGPGGRDPALEVLGQEGFGRNRAIVEIIIPVPGDPE